MSTEKQTPDQPAFEWLKTKEAELVRSNAIFFIDKAMSAAFAAGQKSEREPREAAEKYAALCHVQFEKALMAADAFQKEVMALQKEVCELRDLCANNGIKV